MAGKLAAQVERKKLKLKKIRGKWLWTHAYIDNSPITPALIAHFKALNAKHHWFSK